MWFVLIGLALIVLKVLDIPPVALWAWWWILFPFGLAMLWWSWSDMTGSTERRHMELHEQKRQRRRRSTLKALGLHTRRDDDRD